ncbi:MAG: EAL domain-containing protein [Burkholderiaceae bacterium]|nr:EAL domain-containing protein [Burkholderiaceae bacterium]
MSPILTASLPSSLELVLRAVLMAALSFAGCLVARLLAFESPVGLLVWPAGAIALASGWRYGPVWVLPAAVGAAAWAFVGFESLRFALTALLATSAGPIVAIAAMRKLNAWKPADYRMDAVLRFLLMCGLVAAPLDAAIATLGLRAAGFMPVVHAAHLFIAWWLIDALGLLLVAPALLAWARDGLSHSRDNDEPSGALLDTTAIVLTVFVIAGSLLLSSLGQREYGHALLFFFFPIVAWTSVRMPERTTAMTLFVTAALLLAVRAFEVGDASENVARALEGTVLVLCAVVVALLMQAVATDRRQALARVALQARQDMTTGLLNDRGLLAELAERLDAADRPGYGLIGINVGNFDTVNDLCGPIQALHLEQSVAMLLMRQPGALQAARLSSGRFALMVIADTVASVRGLAREIYAQLNGQVYKADHGSIRLQASVGGLLIDRSVMIDGEDCLLSLSDAMAIAASVRDPQLFVEPLSQTMIDARRSHQGKLEHVREAIREKRLEVYAQPMVDPEAPEGMVAYEVLTRLRDAQGHLIRPPEFLPLAVQAQMTVALDRGVIEMVFAWLSEHRGALERTWKCSINLSGMTMSDGMIASFIREQRARFKIPPGKIVFEITESEAIRNPGAASRLVDELKAEGFGIALDDFGTGLATFEYLKRFPIDYLKIDGSFIRNLVTNPIDEEIVLSTVRVARRLNVKTIAEHVHNQDIYDRLRFLGVEYVQGELVGSARPIAEVFEQIANFHARNAENIAATQAKADSLAQADAQARADAHVEALLRATEPDAPPPPPPLVRPADAVSERSTNAGR